MLAFALGTMANAFPQCVEVRKGNGAAPKVWITGQTVRVQGLYAAVRILRYEYCVPGMGYEWNFDPQDRAAHTAHGSEPRC
ncbi:MAG: hypothetical protein LAQ69_36160 [Acidobacteriia bacterium]|nr:hypothetical protein [Terriglobia bacterium]